MDFFLVASGLRVAEGPVALADGSLLVCEVLGGALHHFGPDGQPLRRYDLGGGPNGAAIGPDGRCYVANNGGLSAEDIAAMQAGRESGGPPSAGCIQAVDLASGAVERLYDSCDGTALIAPNDLVFDAHGGFYFTDFGNLSAPGAQPGPIYHALPDGSRITKVIPRMQRANGIGLSPDGQVLYIAETHSGALWAYRVMGAGRVDLASPTILFCDPAIHLDSLAVEAGGAVCVAAPSSGLIVRVSADGGKADRIAIPNPTPTNICFGGPDRRTAWITGMKPGEVWRTRWDAPGLALRFGG